MDQREFRNTLGTFATGVTIITAKGENGENIGLTANAFSSLSLDPPLILVCIDKKSDSIPAFQKGQSVCCEYIIRRTRKRLLDICKKRN